MLQELQDEHGLDLSGYLIMPVRRIPRYMLLFKVPLFPVVDSFKSQFFCHRTCRNTVHQLTNLVDWRFYFKNYKKLLPI